MSANLINSDSTLNINSLIIQYLPLFIVIVAGLFAIIQVRLNHNANYRLKWIEGFRNSISTLICEANDYSVTLTKIIMDGRKENTNNKTSEADMIRFQNAIKNTTKYLNAVLLFLNPKDKKHQTIIECINNLESACKDSSPKVENFTKSVGKHFDSLVILSQEEISRQWNKSQKWII